MSDNPVFKDTRNAHIKWALTYAAEHLLDFAWPENTDFLYSTLAVEQAITDQASALDALTRAGQAYDSGVKKWTTPRGCRSATMGPGRHRRRIGETVADLGREGHATGGQEPTRRTIPSPPRPSPPQPDAG